MPDHAANSVQIIMALVLPGVVLWSVFRSYRDAEERGKPGCLVALLVFFLSWPLGLLASLVFRPPLPAGRRRSYGVPSVPNVGPMGPGLRLLFAAPNAAAPSSSRQTGSVAPIARSTYPRRRAAGRLKAMTSSFDSRRCGGNNEDN
jgi:hypothetical protein